VALVFRRALRALDVTSAAESVMPSAKASQRLTAMR